MTELERFEVLLDGSGSSVVSHTARGPATATAGTARRRAPSPRSRLNWLSSTASRASPRRASRASRCSGPRTARAAPGRRTRGSPACSPARTRKQTGPARRSQCRWRRARRAARACLRGRRRRWRARDEATPRRARFGGTVAPAARGVDGVPRGRHEHGAVGVRGDRQQRDDGQERTTTSHRGERTAFSRSASRVGRHRCLKC